MNKNIFDLTGKVAIITGGYGHLGRAMVEALAAQGATVINAGRDFSKHEDSFGNSTFKKSINFKEVNIGNTDSIKLLFSETYTEFGHIDILVNNAQYTRGNGPEAISDEDWAFTVDGVLNSVFRCTREVIPYMKKQSNGKIINISSMYGVVSPDMSVYEGDNCEVYINPPHYGASKAAVIQLTKYYAVYLAKYNIQVNTITPGAFPKELVQQENPVFIKKLAAKSPAKRIGKPEDLAGVCILLSSSASDFITGQNFIVDGGWTIW